MVGDWYLKQKELWDSTYHIYDWISDCLRRMDVYANDVDEVATVKESLVYPMTKVRSFMNNMGPIVKNDSIGINEIDNADRAWAVLALDGMGNGCVPVLLQLAREGIVHEGVDAVDDAPIVSNKSDFDDYAVDNTISYLRGNHVAGRMYHVIDGRAYATAIDCICGSLFANACAVRHWASSYRNKMYGDSARLEELNEKLYNALRCVGPIIEQTNYDEIGKRINYIRQS